MLIIPVAWSIWEWSTVHVTRRERAVEWPIGLNLLIGGERSSISLTRRGSNAEDPLTGPRGCRIYTLVSPARDVRKFHFAREAVDEFCRSKNRNKEKHIFANVETRLRPVGACAISMYILSK